MATTAMSCGGDDGVALTVNVVTSLVPQAEFSYVRIENLAPTPLYTPSDVLDTVRRDAVFGQDFAHGVRVAAFDNMTPGEHLISVSLLRADTTILISRRVRVTFDSDFVLRVHLTPDCVGVVCPSPAGSPALSECLGGQCVDERCIPPDGEFCPDISFCNTEADCPAPVADCASRTCVDGVCGVATTGTCEAGMYCDPALGCVALSIVDGGVPIDGAVDGGMPIDAETPDGSTMPDGAVCGSVCVLPDEPCRGGVVSCAGGTATCVPYIVQPVGSACGENRVCDVHGACVDCVAGAACSVGCFSGHVTCGAGYAQCDVSDGTTPLGLGAACSPTGACVAGAPCGSGETCDGSGLCRACVDAAACQVGCETGHVSCADDGVCVLDTILPPGSGCGESVLIDHTLEYTGYCDATSTCVDCVRGESCTTPDGCADGVRHCDNEGLPAFGMCIAAVPHAAGSSCAPGVGDTGDLCNGASECVTAFVAEQLGVNAFSPQANGSCAIDADHKLVCFSIEGTYFKDHVPDAKMVDGDLIAGCLLSVDDELWCWDNTHTPRRVSVPARPASVRVSEQSGSIAALIVLLETGEIVYTDPNTFGLDGTLITYAGASDFVQVASRSVRSSFTALRATGEVLGLSYTGPIYVAGVDDATALVENSSCMMRGATLSCFDTGIGTGSYPYGVAYHLELQNIALPYADVEQVAIVGDYGALCMLRSSGRVSCFGNARSAGRGPSGDFTAPSEIAIDDIVELGTGCMRDGGGRVYCWGDTLGLAGAALMPYAYPTMVSLPEACEVDTACGDGVTLPTCFERVVSRCEGGRECTNRASRIGASCDVGVCNGRGSCYTPFVAHGARFDNNVTCAIQPDGVPACWGYNQEGVLGDPAAPFYESRGVANVVGVSATTELAVGYRYACALDAVGAVKCWGAGDASAVAIPLSSPATHIAAYRPLGDVQVCAVLATSAVECWSPSSAPALLAGIADATAVASSVVHMCFLHASGTVSCMGQNSSGVFGDGTMTSSYDTLVDMLDVDDATAVWASSQTTCVRRSTGAVWCTGNTAFDPLFGTHYEFSPVDIHLPFADAIRVIISDSYGFALRPDGSLWTWLNDPATASESSEFPSVTDDLSAEVCVSNGPNGLYCGYPWSLQPVTAS